MCLFHCMKYEHDKLLYSHLLKKLIERTHIPSRFCESLQKKIQEQCALYTWKRQESIYLQLTIALRRSQQIPPLLPFVLLYCCHYDFLIQMPIPMDDSLSLCVQIYYKNKDMKILFPMCLKSSFGIIHQSLFTYNSLCLPTMSVCLSGLLSKSKNIRTPSLGYVNWQKLLLILH